MKLRVWMAHWTTPVDNKQEIDLAGPLLLLKLTVDHRWWYPLFTLIKHSLLPWFTRSIQLIWLRGLNLVFFHCECRQELGHQTDVAFQFWTPLVQHLRSVHIFSPVLNLHPCLYVSLHSIEIENKCCACLFNQNIRLALLTTIVVFGVTNIWNWKNWADVKLELIVNLEVKYVHVRHLRQVALRNVQMVAAVHYF